MRLAWTPHPLYGLVGPTKYDPTGTTVAASSASSLTLRLPVPEQKEILILFFRKKYDFLYTFFLKIGPYFVFLDIGQRRVARTMWYLISCPYSRLLKVVLCLDSATLSVSLSFF